MPRTVFVTGGAGYVGSHCCKAFSEAGWNVVVYDNLTRGWRDFVKWGPLIEGDILDYEKLSTAIAETKPDVVAHFAAVAYVGESVADPGRYYHVNTAGSLNVLRAMRQNGVEAMVFSSTCATYGVPTEIPISETHVQSPINPYGWSKLFVEQILRDYGAAHGIRSVILRYFNAAGADPDGQIGERHEPETHLIPLAIRGAMSGDYELTIFGDDFDTRDGTCVRDYIHVNDLASGHLKALEYLEAGGASEVFNLGTGSGVSVLEIAAAVEMVSGVTVRKTVGPRRAGDPPLLVASSQKARSVLGWSPTHSNSDDILRNAWDWHVLEHNAVQRPENDRLQTNRGNL
ncbi:UDP-glucose 4-epimerase GalE [Phenylobacterium sp.]|uniref:UDP-glucose 4-epimerase GalE n=1 Tax=Phenylobacterium sp. TaxID=1871053 RepID=UPI0030F42C60